MKKQPSQELGQRNVSDLTNTSLHWVTVRICTMFKPQRCAKRKKKNNKMPCFHESYQHKNFLLKTPMHLNEVQLRRKSTLLLLYSQMHK